MFLTISTTGTAAGPATDLGHLLHKHPDRAQVFTTSYGDAHVFYREASPERTTAALLLEVDPAALLRRGRAKGRGGAPDAVLAQYVNDRPYAASSLLAVALRTVFASALKGVCRALPERAAAALPLRVEVPALPARGGPALVARLFEPLGWQVSAEPVVLDARFPQWGESRYVHLALEGELRLSDALRHLYVLLPVLDDAKHYWVSADEVDKLLRFGAGWLGEHPEQKLITSRYLARRWSLTRAAMERMELARLAAADDADVEELDNAVAAETPDTDASADADADAGPGAGTGARAAGTTAAGATAGGTRTDPAVSADRPSPDGPHGASPDTAADIPVPVPVPLAVRRREAILAALRQEGAARVLDLGCGQGQLVAALLKDPAVTEVVGLDVSARALDITARRLRLDRMGERQAGRLKLLQGSLVYTDARLKGYDAAVLSEVVEHVDLPRLPALEYAVFGAAAPATVVVTTPNVEYNVRWESLPAGHVRHGDHRFEWTRAEFARWAGGVAERYGYRARFVPVGPDDPEVGPPTQMAVLTRSVPAAGTRAAAAAAAPVSVTGPGPLTGYGPGPGPASVSTPASVSASAPATGARTDEEAVV